MRLSPYPRYRPSGVALVSDVPGHWEVRRLKNVVGINEATLPESTDPHYAFRYIEIGAVGTGILMDEPKRINFAAAPSRARRIVSEGDTLVSTVRTYLKAVWFASEIERDLVCSTGFAVLTPRRHTTPGFLRYATQSNPFSDRLTADSVGTAYPAIPEGRIGSFHICVPPLHEQAAIARYLDYVDRRVRRYVEAKRKLIALLEEERQAVIHQAVTRGLDPNVPLKPSGAEWLGVIPIHWEVLRAKYLYREVDERSSTGTEELMSISHKTGVTPRKKNVTMFLAASNVGYKLCRPEDIVVNTMWAYMAALGVARQIGLVSPSYGTYRPIKRGKLTPVYVDLMLRTEAYRINYLLRSTGITSSRLRLYPESFLAIPLLCPPRTEQDSIVEFLDQSVSATNQAITRSRRQIELVEEYRTRLIADVVTGKLDVRAAAAQLPDEADDLDSLEVDGSQSVAGGASIPAGALE